MDHPKCRICGERHRLGPCPSFKEEVPRADVGPKAAVAKLSDIGMPITAGCPVCESRRLKQLEAQKRYRAKKITK